MTPIEFQCAVEIMQQAGTIPAGHGWKTALAAKLGLTRTSIDNFERDGTKQKQTDYAIAAIIAGVAPHGTPPL